MKRYIKLFIVLISLAFSFAGEIAAQNVYLFSYFKGNGEDGLHLAYSYNGREWHSLKNDQSFLTPTVGSKLMRDPSIMQDKDGVFRLVWTTGWWDNGFGYASSKDLIHWSDEQYVPAMAYEPTAKNTWAPELLYDEEGKQFIICWSSWIPGRYPGTDSTGHILSSDPNKPRMSHRIYALTTKDFKTFGPSHLFYEPGFNVIDAAIKKHNGKYIMFCKDETLIPPKKNIRVAYSDKAEGPYGQASEPITGSYWAEGPTPIFIGDTCYVYFDKYRDKKFGAVMSTDMKKWKDISDEITFPAGIRHGTVFIAPKSILDGLLKE